MRKLLTPLILLLLLPLPAVADEGMWMVHAIDAALQKRMVQRGLQLPAGAIYDADAPGATLTDAVASLGFYCTGSLVSPEGLLLTNHHCAYSDVAAISTPDHNYLEDGFWAMDRRSEIPLKGKKVFFLRRVMDVTEEVAALEDSLARRGERFGYRKISYILEKKYAGISGLEASLDRMWSGEKYYVSLYKTYDDVRLVGVPPVSVASFGGDEDNWEWPQHKADFAFFRIYENGEPLKSPNHLEIASTGVQEGDFAMVLGFPGRTRRYSTPSARIRFEESILLPTENRLQARRMEIIRRWMDADPQVRMKYSDAFFSLSNAAEMQQGQLECLRRFRVGEERAAEEADLPGGLLDTLKAEYAAIGAVEKEKAVYRETLIRGTHMARTILRMSNAREGKEAIYKAGLEEVDALVEKELLAAALEEYFAGVSIVGDGQNALRQRFSDYGDMAEWLWNHPEEWMDFIGEVKITDFNAREHHVGNLTDLLSRYGRALYASRASRGILQYPDANSTLRLSYGAVSTLEPRDGILADWRSSAAGIFQKADPSHHDFAPPEAFLSALKGYGGTVNFLTDNDITGGNSGSPVLDANGRLVGLAFDGNKESLASDYSCTSAYNRCVCVDIRYILWYLSTIPSASPILSELTR